MPRMPVAQSHSILATLRERLEKRTARIAVVGLGYVGIPLAAEAAQAGYHVLGIDVSSQRVETVRQGRSPVQDVPSERLATLRTEGRLDASTSFDQARDMDVIVICVPTPVDRFLVPELSAIRSVVASLVAHVRAGQLVVLESTTYPGCTDEIVRDGLAASGLEPDVDFFVAHSPERVDPGNKRFMTRNTPKLVGGVGPNSLAVAKEFYSTFIDTVVPVSSARAAELAKVYENTFRAVNIALVNEMAQACDSLRLDVWEVLDAAFTKPFGIMRFYPGPGVGGHCIPIDPHYLEWKAKEAGFSTHMVTLAAQLNRSMPRFVREKALRALNQAGLAPSRARILVLGVAYKANVDDWRDSPVLDVLELLRQDGSAVDYADPHVPSFRHHGVSWAAVPYDGPALATYDLVILATDHAAFDPAALVSNAKLLLDTRNFTKGVRQGRTNVVLL